MKSEFLSDSSPSNNYHFPNKFNTSKLLGKSDLTNNKNKIHDYNQYDKVQNKIFNINSNLFINQERYELSEDFNINLIKIDENDFNSDAYLNTYGDFYSDAFINEKAKIIKIQTSIHLTNKQKIIQEKTRISSPLKNNYLLASDFDENFDDIKIKNKEHFKNNLLVNTIKVETNKNNYDDSGFILTQTELNLNTGTLGMLYLPKKSNLHRKENNTDVFKQTIDPISSSNLKNIKHKGVQIVNKIEKNTKLEISSSECTESINEQNTSIKHKKLQFLKYRNKNLMNKNIFDGHFNNLIHYLKKKKFKLESGGLHDTFCHGIKQVKPNKKEPCNIEEKFKIETGLPDKNDDNHFELKKEFFDKINSISIKQLEHHSKDYYLFPVPKDQTFICKIKVNRIKSKFGNLFPIYTLHINNSDRFLIAAKKVKFALNNQYIFSINYNSFDFKSESYIGRLDSNFLGNSFIIIDYRQDLNSKRENNLYLGRIQYV